MIVTMYECVYEALSQQAVFLLITTINAIDWHRNNYSIIIELKTLCQIALIPCNQWHISILFNKMYVDICKPKLADTQ